MEKEELNKIFSTNLNYWLNERGKNQADLYKKMNVSSATASDWCNGKKIPRADKLVVISEWLMIPLSSLLQENNYLIDISEGIRIKLKNDSDFREIVSSIYSLNPNRYNELKSYIKFLSQNGD